MDLIDHLAHFARDQLSAIKGWHGQAYVEKCLTLWEQAYGPSVAAAVRAALGASLSRRGPD